MTVCRQSQSALDYVSILLSPDPVSISMHMEVSQALAGLVWRVVELMELNGSSLEHEDLCLLEPSRVK
jgi:hypothetical protein